MSDDPEILHQLRVAVRRLRALLWAYRPVLPKGFARHWQKELGEMAALIGTARDWDILIEVLLPAAKLPEDDTAPLLRAALGEARRQARQIGQQAVASARLGQRLAAFKHALDEAAASENNEACPIAHFAQTRVAAASRRLDRRLKRAMDGSMKELHRTRIAIKRLRYLLEYFHSVLDEAASQRIKHLTEVQDALGELNDVVVGASHIGSLPGAAAYGPAQARLRRWLSQEKTVRRHKAVDALGHLRACNWRH